jgi:hypothetical protein
MTFQLKHYMLPHEGIILGARGHKKITIAAGTKVFCIVYGTKIYWAAYLNEQQGLQVMANLEDCVHGRARRSIKLNTLLEWNFANTIPRRICRPR